jgi:NADH:ubiquinone oxidoreductase subunit E
MQTDNESPGPCVPCAGQDTDTERLSELVSAHDGRLGALVSILQDVQAEYGYLPEAALRTVGELTGRPLVDVYGLATFYRTFRLTPRGTHVISVCQGTACHVRGATRVLEEMERQLGIRQGQTTADGQFTLETVNCLGACALGPVLVVDGTYHPHVDTAKVRRIVAQLRREPSTAAVAVGSTSKG